MRALIACAAVASGSVVAAPECTQGALPSMPRQVKWHPGHYVTLPFRQGRDSNYLIEVTAELSANSVLRGIQKRYTWAELEPQEGRYNFDAIEQDLAKIAHANKYLIVLLQLKAFSEAMDVVPKYLRGAAYDGGTFALDIPVDGSTRTQARSGSNLKLWNHAVRDRLAALVCAMGDRFNAHPNLEAVALTETAIGRAREPLTPLELDGYFDSLVTVQRSLRVAFPNTVTLQFVNYPSSHIASFTARISEFGTGIGGPDTFADDPGLTAGAYKLYPSLAGRVPLAPSVQPENYFARRHRGPLQPQKPEELYDIARRQLHANYIFWTRHETKTQKPWPEVLKMFRSPGFPTDPAGGLAPACPSAFESCSP
jgi:hypothetical protein